MSLTITYAKVRDIRQKRNEHDPELQERYLPSNGSEGMDFEGAWCENGCRFYVNRKAGYTDCTKGILIHQHGRAEPVDRTTWHKAWRYVEGRPSCTAYQERGASRDRAKREAEAYQEAMKQNKSHLKLL